MKNVTEQFVKAVFRKMGIDLRRLKAKNGDKRVVHLKSTSSSKGNVLLSYIIDPFLLESKKEKLDRHTHHWESLQIAKTFLDFSYNVDVVDYRDKTFIPRRNYSIFVSARTNFERISNLLSDDCLKIVHLDTSHWMFNNSAVYARAHGIKERRGVALGSINRKLVEANWAIENCDLATILGNGQTISTYDYAGKLVIAFSIPTITTYAWADEKDFEACRMNYLWFGSDGLVHKGLDLALEVFSMMPEYHLTVCGPIRREPDFENAFHKELYSTDNIRTVGWVDPKDRYFREIANNCIGLIYPSCAEGQSGAVATCLQAGLIPIVSKESGFDVQDFGLTLTNCSHLEIENSIRKLSNIPGKRLRKMARKTWKFARENHTRQRYAQEYHKFVSRITTHLGNKEELKRVLTCSVS